MLIVLYLFGQQPNNAVFCLQSRRTKKQKKGDLDDLKQELDIDFHKITVEELYQRFSTHPDTVSTLY